MPDCSDSWRKPSRTGAGRRFLERREREAETWETRLLAVLLAVPVFEASLMLGMLAASNGHGGAAAMLVLQLPLWLHLALCSMAVAVGAIWGMGGITWLLGHLFWTHPVPQQRRWITTLLWVSLLVLPMMLMWLGG